MLTEPRDRVGRISSLVPSATAGDENGGVGNEESDRGGEGGGGGGSGGGGGQEGVEGESEGLKLYKWEHNVFSIASSRPQADLSGFRYTEESEVSGEGCGKETCTIAPRTGGEVGACYCPVPVGVEDSDLQLNPVCQCDPQLRSPGQECRFSVADRDLPPVKKLLVLGVGVVAGEDTPEGSLVAVCKGQVSFGILLRFPKPSSHPPWSIVTHSRSVPDFILTSIGCKLYRLWTLQVFN